MGVSAPPRFISMNLSYKFSSKHTNSSKLEPIRELAKAYQAYYNITVSKALRNFYKTGSLPKFLPIMKCPNNNFSERYKQTCGKQVKSNIESLLSKCKKILKIFSLNGENSLLNTGIKENFLILNGRNS